MNRAGGHATGTDGIGWWGSQQVSLEDERKLVRTQANNEGHIRGEIGMLILTRRVGETLMIGDDITVSVLGVKGIRFA